MIFKLIAGTFFDGGKVHKFVRGKEPPLVVSDLNLEEIHGRSMFIRIDTPAPPAGVIPETGKPIINLAQMVADRGMPAGVEPPAPTEEVFAEPLMSVRPAERTQPVTIVDDVSSPPVDDLGEDVTEDFPVAIANDLVVTRRKGRFFIRQEANKSEIVGSKSGYVPRNQVQSVIDKYAESLVAG